MDECQNRVLSEALIEGYFCSDFWLALNWDFDHLSPLIKMFLVKKLE
jgi:hypothetical protein